MDTFYPLTLVGKVVAFSYNQNFVIESHTIYLNVCGYETIDKLRQEIELFKEQNFQKGSGLKYCEEPYRLIFE